MNFSGPYFYAFVLNTDIYRVNVFSPNARNGGSEGLRIWKLFTP